MEMKCPRCHQEKAEAFYTYQGRTYCRACLSFGKIYVDESLSILPKRKYPKQGSYHLDYDLSIHQQDISEKIMQSLYLGHHVYVMAVCGSGKTEIVYEAICYYLRQGKRVAFALPRRELAKEIYERLARQFTNVAISLVYGSHTHDLTGQLVVLTTHQLFRFVKAFDLIVVDEIDAFPFAGNDLLHACLKNASKGERIMMSATLDPTSLDASGDLYILNRRYHDHDLPVPKQVISWNVCLDAYLIFYLRRFKQKGQPVLLFAPTFKMIHRLEKLLHCFSFRFKKATSHEKEVMQSIALLKNRELDFLLCTSILERGVTIVDVQVIIYHGEHPLYDRATLIQIAGRVGRHKDHPNGEVIILATKKTQAMQSCVSTIEDLNHMSVSSV